MESKRLKDVLDEVKQRVGNGQLPILVFDLDSTLFSTAKRHLAILGAFAQSRPEDKHLNQVIAGLTPEDFSWNPSDALCEKGITDPEVLKAFRQFWFERFFTDEYVCLDDPNPGAMEFVQATYEAGGFIYYLTGRHINGMLIGTKQGLEDHGFPLDKDRTFLHLKPAFEMNDEAFKMEAIHKIRGLDGVVVATFENEPGNANRFEEAFPEAEHFLLLTEHSPNAEEPSKTLIPVKDFLLS